MAYVISDDCIACGTCIDECPVNTASTLKCVQIVELAQMLVLLKQFIRQNKPQHR